MIENSMGYIQSTANIDVPLWAVMLGCDKRDNMIERNAKSTDDSALTDSIRPERWVRFLPDYRIQNANIVIGTQGDIKRFRERIWYVICSLRLYYTGDTEITMDEIQNGMATINGMVLSGIHCPEQLDTRRCDIPEKEIPPYSMLKSLYIESKNPDRFDEIRWARMMAMSSMIENTCEELVASNMSLIRSMGFDPDKAERTLGCISMRRGRMLLTAEPAYCIPELPIQMHSSKVRLFYCDGYNKSVYEHKLALYTTYYPHKNGFIAPVWFAKGLLSPLGDKIFTDTHLKWRE